MREDTLSPGPGLRHSVLLFQFHEKPLSSTETTRDGYRPNPKQNIYTPPSKAQETLQKKGAGSL